MRHSIQDELIAVMMHLGLRRGPGERGVRGYPRARGQVAPPSCTALYAAPAIAGVHAPTPPL